MSVKQTGLVWEHEWNHQGELLVMLALADHANHEGGSIYPSRALIAWKTGHTERSVRRILGALRDRGVLVVVREHDPRRGSYRPTEYRIEWSAAAQKTPRERLEDEGGNDVPPTPEGGHGRPVGGTPVTGRGDTRDRQGGTPVTPEPSIEPSIEPSEEENTRAREDSVEIEKVETTLEEISERELAERLVSTWNEFATPYGLAPVLKVNPARERAAKKLRKDFDGAGEALGAFALAVRQVVAEGYYAENGYGFDNLLRDGRVLTYAEKAVATGARDPKEAASDRRAADIAARLNRIAAQVDAEEGTQ